MIFSTPRSRAVATSFWISGTDRWQVERIALYWAVRSSTSISPSIGLPSSSKTSMPVSSDLATVLFCLS